ncbi:hypothetical protein KC19_4G112500 [Ceratodon purpureus]|uniref:Uncharacterized protein n=1 Tax=Ceratodon purpureus TaxID=3225 RepID=A0A8T0I7H8_CERPU|nr:hypothetical protein KC19_4G112500 [Ceratodon purpureus]
MSSNSAPYATLHDLPKFEKRTADVRAPWFKEQAAVKNVRGQDPLPYVTCNSKNAPYATFDNVPKPAELCMQPSAPVPGTSGVQQLNPTNGSQLPQDRKHSAPYGTSNDIILPRAQANLAKVHQAPWDRSDRKLDHHPSQATVPKVHQAPWDRNDVHHKVQPRFPRGEDAPHYTSSNAPYATDSKRG